jgi:hypothetical protein
MTTSMGDSDLAMHPRYQIPSSDLCKINHSGCEAFSKLNPRFGSLLYSSCNILSYLKDIRFSYQELIEGPLSAKDFF